MESHPEEFKLTEEDIKIMERKIAAFDLSRERSILKVIPEKLESMVKSVKLNEFTTELINDVSRLYNILSAMPSLNDDLKRKILYALDYFVVDDDEIPDEIPGLGYLDDLVVVRYIVDQITANNKEIYQS